MTSLGYPSNNGNLPSSMAQGCPPRSVLVTALASGLVLVQGYPTGPTAYVLAEDAAPLRAALTAVSSPPGSDSAYSQIAAPPLVRPRIGDPSWE